MKSNKYNTFTSEEYEKQENEPSSSQHASFMPLVATLVLFASVFFSALSSASVQILSGTIPEFELNAWRFGVQLIMLVPIIMCKKCQIRVPRHRLFIVGLSVLLLNALNVLIFTTVIYLPLGLSDGLINAFIIAGNAVLSICIKSDRKLILYVAAILSIIGAVLMIQPDFIFSNANLPPPPVVNWTTPCISNTLSSFTDFTVSNGTHNETLSHPGATENSNIGYFYAIATSGTLLAYYYASSKMVEDVDPFNFAFWAALIGTIVSVVLMLIFEEPVFLQSVFCIGILILHCVGTSTISVLVPWSLQYISPTVCTLVCASRMVVMVIFQYTIMYNIKPGLQNWVELLGAVICFFGMIGGPLTDTIKEMVDGKKPQLIIHLFSKVYLRKEAVKYCSQYGLVHNSIKQFIQARLINSLSKCSSLCSNANL